MKKEKQNQKIDNFMTYVPKQKHGEWEMKKGKVYLIFQHEKKAEKFLRWLVKKPTVSDIELDDMGGEVWKLIDGKTSVYDMGQKLIQHFGEKCEPVYERLTMYLRYLNRKGWIAFERGDQGMTASENK